MFNRLSKHRQKRREQFPDDDPAVVFIMMSLKLGAKSARDAAEIAFGRPLTDEEWKRFGPHWERAWTAIVAKNG